MFLKYATYLSLLPLYVHTFITRLPCKLHANFSQITENERFNGSVLETFTGVVLGKCGSNCLAKPLCMYFNYDGSNSVCELVTGNPFMSQLVNQPGWKAYSTDYRPKKTVNSSDFSINWGPYCDVYNPCTPAQLCQDICQTPGYKCVDLDDITSFGVANQSSDAKEEWQVALSIDGLLDTFSKTKREINCWWQIDLQTSYNLVAIQFWKSGLVGFQLTAGNSANPRVNPAVTLDVRFSVGDYHTFNGFVSARYVSLVFLPLEDLRQCELNEIKIFAPTTAKK